MGRVPSALMELHDLRKEPGTALSELIERLWRERSTDGLLTVSIRPSKRWAEGLGFARPLTLSSAPLYELVLWVDRDLELALPDEVKEDQQQLLEGYRRLFASPTDGDLDAYLDRLMAHVKHQESQLFPYMAQKAPLERCLRELGYEHRGLEKGAEVLRQVLLEQRQGNMDKKRKDRLDLDFFHLLEHHLERERDAVIPAWRMILKASPKRLDRAE